MLLQSDCEILVKVFSGRASFAEMEDEEGELIKNIALVFDLLHHLFVLGVRPPSGYPYHIVWAPRHENRSADWVCNHAMQRGLGVDTVVDPRLREAELVLLATDGGYRGDTGLGACSAIFYTTGSDQEACVGSFATVGKFAGNIKTELGAIVLGLQRLLQAWCV